MIGLSRHPAEEYAAPGPRPARVDVYCGRTSRRRPPVQALWAGKKPSQGLPPTRPYEGRTGLDGCWDHPIDLLLSNPRPPGAWANRYLMRPTGEAS